METERLTVLSHLHGVQLSETLMGCLDVRLGRGIKRYSLLQNYRPSQHYRQTILLLLPMKLF